MMDFIQCARKNGPGQIGGVFLLLLMSACSSAQEPNLIAFNLEKKANEAFLKGNLALAEKDDKAALAIDRHDPELFNNLAVIEDQEGHRKAALDDLKRGESIRPGDTGIILNRARLELEFGNDVKALELAKKIRSSEKWPDGFRTLMGKIDIDLDRYQEAHLYLHEAALRHPGNPLVLTYLGIVHIRIGDPVQGRKDFEKALRMHPPAGLRRSLLRLLRDPHAAIGMKRTKSAVLQGFSPVNK